MTERILSGKGLVGDLETLRGQVVRGGIGSIVAKVVTVGLSLGVTVLLARFLEPEGYGIYALITALIHILAVPALMGLPQLVIRETTKAEAKGEWGRLRGLWQWSGVTVLVLSVLVAGITGAIVWLLGGAFDEVKAAALFLGLAMIPIVALGNLYGAAIRGLGRVVVGQLPESVIRNLALLIFLLVALQFAQTYPISPLIAVALHTAAAAFALVVAAYLFLRFRPAGVAADPAGVYDIASWLRSALSLALIDGLQLVNAHLDVLMLGLLRSDSEVGVYRVVVQSSTLIVFGLHAVNMVIMPHVSRLYADGDRARLQRLVTHSARLVILTSLPVSLVLILFGDSILVLVFGEVYITGYVALAILSVAQLVNAGMGSVGLLLNMTGHERESIGGMAVATALNILLNFLLIPTYGIEGAAFATATSTVVWNLILRAAVRRCLEIEPTALGGDTVRQ